MRYADILNYEIQAEPEALDCRIQKLSLQPLVENALYHGIEKKRGGGTIRVCADVKDGCLVVQVADDGCGMTPEKLEEVQREVAGDLGQISEGGFGLPNIQKRIQLAYGADYGIHVSSRLGCGDSGHTADSGKIVKKLRSSRKKQKSGFPAGLFSVKFK